MGSWFAPWTAHLRTQDRAAKDCKAMCALKREDIAGEVRDTHMVWIGDVPTMAAAGGVDDRFVP